jgi:hypothetical protein
MTILRGPILQGRYLAVPSGQVDLRPPKIIIGLSLTLPSERYSLPSEAVTLPTLLDTGFNRILEIDEWHLVHWAGLRKESLATIAKDRISDGRKYDLCEATLWLHRTPYEGPRMPRGRAPLMLDSATQVRVMATTGKPNPRLPLLGLDTLIQNDLQLRIDGAASRFRIYRSLKSIVSSFLAGK